MGRFQTPLENLWSQGKLQPWLSANEARNWFCFWWQQCSCVLVATVFQSGAIRKWEKHSPQRAPVRCSIHLWAWRRSSSLDSQNQNCLHLRQERIWPIIIWTHHTLPLTSYQLSKLMSCVMGKLVTNELFASIIIYYKGKFQNLVHIPQWIFLWGQNRPV